MPSLVVELVLSHFAAVGVAQSRSYLCSGKVVRPRDAGLLTAVMLVCPLGAALYQIVEARFLRVVEMASLRVAKAQAIQISMRWVTEVAGSCPQRSSLRSSAGRCPLLGSHQQVTARTQDPSEAPDCRED